MAEKEYIERGALLRHIFDQIKEHGDPDPIDSPVARGSLMGLEYAHAVVSVLPAADVVEVRHGEWRTAIEYKESRTTECSACHEEFWFMKKGQLNIDKMKYCPNCGAKMEGGKT